MIKYAVISILTLLPMIGLSITSLIMSAGKFWKCPGQPLLFTWLLGFGTNGILFAWFCIIMVIERAVRRDTGSNRTRIFFPYVIIIMLFFIFALVWTVLGIIWMGTQLVEPTYYYLNGQNLYCDPILFSYTQAMSFLTVASLATSVCLIFVTFKLCYD